MLKGFASLSVKTYLIILFLGLTAMGLSYEFLVTSEVHLISPHSLHQGSMPGRQLECWRWLQQLTSLQIFTIYTALEKHAYRAASMLGILHLPQNLSFYLTSALPTQATTGRQTDC